MRAERLFVFIVSLCLEYVNVGSAANNYITMDVKPSTKIRVGDQITITCSVDRSKSTRDLVWWKTTADLTYRFGRETEIEDRYFRTENNIITRYQISGGSSGDYQLIIKDAKPQDSGKYDCLLHGTQEFSSSSVAVCEDPDHDVCKCFLREGWSSPGCYEPKTLKDIEGTYRNRVIGLAVCFVIVAIIAIVLAILLARDCLASIHKKRKRLQERSRQQNNVAHSGEHADSNRLVANNNRQSNNLANSHEEARHSDKVAAGNGSGQRTNMAAGPYTVEGNTNLGFEHDRTIGDSAGRVYRNMDHSSTPSPNYGRTQPVSAHGQPAAKYGSSRTPAQDYSSTNTTAVHDPQYQDTPPAYNSVTDNRRYPSSSHSDPRTPSSSHSDPRTPVNKYPSNRAPHATDPSYYGHNNDTEQLDKKNTASYPAKSPGTRSGQGFIYPELPHEANGMPGSVRSAGPPYTADQSSEYSPRNLPPDVRGAYTEAAQIHDSRHGGRTRYTEPRRLDFVAGQSQSDNDTSPDDNRPYISNTPTVL